MIKFVIKRVPYVEGFVMCNYEFLKVSNRDLEKYLRDGWILEKKEYFIISKISNLWNSYTKEKKTDIILVFISIIIGWLLSKI